MRNTFLVTYDICQDKRLAKVHKTMRGFGDHLQYSVFECQLTRADLARMDYVGKNATYAMNDVHAENVRFAWQALADSATPGRIG